MTSLELFYSKQKLFVSTELFPIRAGIQHGMILYQSVNAPKHQQGCIENHPNSYIRMILLIDYRLSAVGAGYGFMYTVLVLIIWATLQLIRNICHKDALYLKYILQ